MFLRSYLYRKNFKILISFVNFVIGDEVISILKKINYIIFEVVECYVVDNF